MPSRGGTPGETLRGFLLGRDWRDGRDGIELHYWLCSEAGPVQVRVSGERSVFFLTATDARLHATLFSAPGIECRPLELRDFAGHPVVAVYCRGYRQARQLAETLRTRGVEPLEADINPADRFLMERFIAGGAELHGEVQRRNGVLQMRNPQWRPAPFEPKLRLLSFDIETAMDGLQLFSIAVHATGRGGEVRRVFMLGEGARQPWVQACSDQKALLQAFLAWLREDDPDVLVGWNVVGFDCWFLQRLADHLGVPLGMGRAGATLVWRERDGDAERRVARVPGRLLMDGIEWLRAAFYRFESFSLQAVAGELLGQSKLLHGSDRGGEIARLFREDKTALAAYNLRDCELVTEIFRHTRLLEFALARSSLTGLNPDRLGGSVASFDNLYLPRLHRSGHVAPNPSRTSLNSPGGYVLDSRPGIYDHVLVLDFKSLYPSIIRTFCVDPLGLALGVSGELAESDTVPGFLEARFARTGHILPGLLQSLWEKRDLARAAGDAPLGQAIKILMNSFYGVLGSPGCRFFDPRLATSITRRGHEILQCTRAQIEARGHQVIYGDTDSVFVWVANARDDAEAEAAGRALETDLNQWWRRDIAARFGLDSALQLEFETHYRRFLMPTIRGSDKGSKKRYAGLVRRDGGDQLVFKGLESVRTDWTRLARDVQAELYRRIFLEQSWQEYLRGVVADLLAGACDDQLIYRKRLRRRLSDYERNVPPHVQAARLFEERGLAPPGRGDWVEYVITTAGPEPAAAPAAALDYQHYLERQLAPVADGILGFLDTSFAAVAGRQLDLF